MEKSRVVPAQTAKPATNNDFPWNAAPFSVFSVSQARRCVDGGLVLRSSRVSLPTAGPVVGPASPQIGPANSHRAGPSFLRGSRETQAETETESAAAAAVCLCAEASGGDASGARANAANSRSGEGRSGREATMNEQTRALVERRANHFSEALSALCGLVAAWPADRQDLAYGAAVTFLKSACRSCGEPQYRAELCRDCYEAFRLQPPPTNRPAA